MAVSTVARLVKTLELSGFLEHVPGSVRYRLGMPLYYLGKVVENRMDVGRLAQPILNQLAQSTGESADLYIRHGDHRICIAQAHGVHTVRHIIPLGERLPLWAGSAGVVLLAYTDKEEAWRILASVQSLTPHTVLDQKAWAKRLEGVRRSGYAATTQERELGAASVSAPVFRGDGQVAAVIGISGPAPRFNSSTLPGHIAAVRDAASRLSFLMGHQSNEPQ